MTTLFAVSDRFSTYLTGVIDNELRRSMHRAKETVARELWAAASHDHFEQTGDVRPLVDTLSVPVREAQAYRVLIDAALARFVSEGFIQGTRQDPLFEQARAFVLASHDINAVELQRHLKIGYTHALGLMEAIESIGQSDPLSVDDTAG